MISKNPENPQLDGIEQCQTFIVSIKKKPYVDLRLVESDLEELSDRVGFRIRGVKVRKKGHNEVVEAYFNGFSETLSGRIETAESWIKHVIWYTPGILSIEVKMKMSRFSGRSQ